MKTCVSKTDIIKRFHKLYPTFKPTRMELRRHSQLYHMMHRYNLVDKYCQPSRCKTTKENIALFKKIYPKIKPYRTELAKDHSDIYDCFRRYKLLDLYCKLSLKKSVKDSLKEYINKYGKNKLNRTELSIKYSTLYHYALKQGIIDKLAKPSTKHKVSQAISLFKKKYKHKPHRGELHDKDQWMYALFKRYGLLGRYCADSMAGPYSQTYVNSFFKEEGCVLLSPYKRSNIPLDYLCSCGNKSKISFSSFVQGSRCHICGSKSTRNKRRESLPWVYDGVCFLSKEEIACYRFLKTLKIPFKYGYSLEAKEIDFFINNQLFWEHHPPWNVYKESFGVYKRRRRRLLDEHGYEHYPLIVTRHLNELEFLYLVFKSMGLTNIHTFNLDEIVRNRISYIDSKLDRAIHLFKQRYKTKPLRSKLRRGYPWVYNCFNRHSLIDFYCMPRIGKSLKQHIKEHIKQYKHKWPTFKQLDKHNHARYAIFMKYGVLDKYAIRNPKISIKDMCNLAKSKQGKLLSTKYINSATKLKWQCKYKHNWNAVPNSIKQGHWCPICGRKQRLITLRQNQPISGRPCLSLVIFLCLL